MDDQKLTKSFFIEAILPTIMNGGGKK